MSGIENRKRPADEPIQSLESKIIVRSSTKTIANVPLEPLEQIFGYLSPRSDLLSASLVCKRWFNVINDNVRLMGKMRIKLVLENVPQVDAEDLNKLTRKYSKVIVGVLRPKYGNEARSKCQELIYRTVTTSLSDSLTRLELLLLKITSQLITSLASCVHLQHLTFNYCWKGSNSESADKIELKQLKSLEFICSPLSILELFKIQQLESFNVQESDDFDLYGGQLIEFLNQLNRLDELSLRLHYWRDWVSEIGLKPKFELSKLDLSLADYQDWRRDDEEKSNATAKRILSTLCQATKETSDINITIENSLKLGKEFTLFELEFLSSCNHINTLTLTGEFPSALLELQNLSKVNNIVFEECPKLGSYQQLWKKFPHLANLEKFEIKSPSHAIDLKTLIDNKDDTELSEMIRNKITHLDIAYSVMKIRHLKSFHFLNLNVLRVQLSVYNDDFAKEFKHLKTFCKRHSNLKQLEIELRFYKLREQDFKERLQTLNLISLYDEFGTTLETCELICWGRKDMWTSQNSEQSKSMLLGDKELSGDEEKFFILIRDFHEKYPHD